METAAFETDLSLFKYDNLEQLPPAYRDLDEDERTERIEAALAELGDDVVGTRVEQREQFVDREVRVASRVRQLVGASGVEGVETHHPTYVTE